MLRPEVESRAIFSPLRAKRFHWRGMRFYYYTEDGPGGSVEVSKFYPSGTTLIDKGQGKPEALVRWYADKGWRKAMETLWFSSRYGTFLHIAQAELSAKMVEAGTNQVDLAVEDLREAFEAYQKASALPEYWLSKYWEQLCRDLAAWRIFCLRYHVEFLLIEKSLFNQADGYAVTVDYVAAILDGPRYQRDAKGGKKYELKDPQSAERLVVNIDVKSGRSGLHESGAMQLKMAAVTIEKALGIRVDRSYHYHPNDWRSAPTFSFTDATDHPEGDNVPEVITIAKRRIGQVDDQPFKTSVSGSLMGSEAEAGFEIETKSVRQVIEEYESGALASFPGNADRDADSLAADFLKKSIR